MLLVLTSCPDAATAARIGQALVDARVAACVSRFPIDSIYRWQDRLEQAGEVALLIKTAPDRYGALEALLRRLHPYEVPEILALPVQAALGAYSDWVMAQTRTDTQAKA